MSDNVPITLSHNRECGTSRNVLAIVRAAGYEPRDVEYLKTGWVRRLLAALERAPSSFVKEDGEVVLPQPTRS